MRCYTVPIPPLSFKSKIYMRANSDTTEASQGNQNGGVKKDKKSQECHIEKLQKRAKLETLK